MKILYINSIICKYSAKCVAHWRKRVWQLLFEFIKHFVLCVGNICYRTNLHVYYGLRLGPLANSGQILNNKIL